MSSIFASKLYITSSRKDKISSAFNNPANAGLTRQLAEYLDEEYQTKENLGIVDHEEQEDTSVENESIRQPDGDIDSHPSSSPAPSPAPSHPSGSLTHEVAEYFDDDSGNTSEPDLNDVPTESAPDGDVQESVSIEGVEEADPVSVDDIKSVLNDSEDASGVSRVSRSKDEIWIYYNDRTNLNNVMESVINEVGKLDPLLVFNRLARTENAIVFAYE